MAVHTPENTDVENTDVENTDVENSDVENTDAPAEPTPESAMEISDPSKTEVLDAVEDPEASLTAPSGTVPGSTPPRRLLRRRVLIPVIAAASVIVLFVAGWLVYTSIKHANELAAAKQAYETSLAELSAAQDAAKTAEANLSAASDTLSAHGAVAEVLSAQLGEGTDLLKAAAASVGEANTVLALAGPDVPAKSAGELPENPDIADYDALREDVAALSAKYAAFTKTLVENTEARDEQNAILLDAWAAQAATAPGTAKASVAANPNAAKKIKDAVTAAAQGIADLENPLDATAPELWKALQDTTASAVAAEKAYQAKKAAEAEAARKAAAQKAARSTPRGGSSGGARGGSSGGSSKGVPAAAWRQLEQSYAKERGIPVSDVRCFDTGFSIRCTHPGGSTDYTI